MPEHVFLASASPGPRGPRHAVNTQHAQTSQAIPKTFLSFEECMDEEYFTNTASCAGVGMCE